MVLIVADIHFGKGDAEFERAKEHDLVNCLRSYAGQLEELILLGDTFDYYIEYRHLVPKGFTRFLGQLSALADDGVEITYFAGNHDPWHRDYFQTEFDARFVLNDETRSIHGQRCYFFHGDGTRQNGGLYRWLRPVLRHPFPVSIYRGLLPGDLGVRLARWVSLNFATRAANRATANGLKAYAERILDRADVDLVVLGHCHFAENHELPGGRYFNPGSWHLERTFVLLDKSGPQLLRWDRTQPTAYEAGPLPDHPATVEKDI